MANTNKDVKLCKILPVQWQSLDWSKLWHNESGLDAMKLCETHEEAP